jgi:hypothetical protein
MTAFYLFPLELMSWLAHKLIKNKKVLSETTDRRYSNSKKSRKSRVARLEEEEEEEDVVSRLEFIRVISIPYSTMSPPTGSTRGEDPAVTAVTATTLTPSTSSSSTDTDTGTTDPYHETLKQRPVLFACIGVLHTLLTAGIVFGWASLLPILRWQTTGQHCLSHLSATDFSRIFTHGAIGNYMVSS